MSPDPLEATAPGTRQSPPAYSPLVLVKGSWQEGRLPGECRVSKESPEFLEWLGMDTDRVVFDPTHFQVLHRCRDALWFANICGELSDWPSLWAIF